MSTQDSTELGARLRRLRGERSQEEFTAMVGLSRSALANYETGRTTPKPSILRDISRRMGVSDDFLSSGVFRNEYEAYLILTGNGFPNDSHESPDEISLIKVLRAVQQDTVRKIVGLLLDEVAESHEARGRMKGGRSDADVARLVAIYKAGGVFEKGDEDKLLDAAVRNIALKARQE